MVCRAEALLADAKMTEDPENGNQNHSTSEAAASIQAAPAPAVDSPRLHWFVRIFIATGGAIAIVLLGTAASLKPNVVQVGPGEFRKMGTHHGLGLPPCSFRVMVGMPCPSCGMTTSWSHTMRGQLWQALEANIGGTLLAISALVYGPYMLISGIRGRWFLAPFNELYAAVIAFTIIAITLVSWCVRDVFV